MCRLIGEFSFGAALTDEGAFRALTRLSEKGGPDDSGFYKDAGIQLGFNRLSILDLTDQGKQPKMSLSERYLLVFNGEIYNHLDLREKLKGFNKFRGNSDTETLVNCIDEWGVLDTVDMLDGMFAMAVFDKKEHSVYLVRDFAGIKPLFYGYNTSGVVFASQYDQVARHKWFVDEKLDNEVLSLYLRMQYIPAPYGLLSNTYQVLPGEIVKISRSGEKTHKRYWELPKDNFGIVDDRDTAIRLVNEKLNISVKQHLLSDVPLGAFLSGGIDSALVCNYASKNKDDKLNTFTIGSDSPVHDESDDALRVAKAINADYTIEKMDSNYALGMIDKVFKVMSEPVADPSIIPTFLVSSLARKGVTVALSGDGGDELFFGYERFQSVVKNRKFINYPYWIKYLLYGTDRVFWKNRHINSGVLLESSGMSHQLLQARFEEMHLNAIFGEYSDKLIKTGFGVYDYNNTNDQRELLARMRYAEFYGMMQKTLRKVDLASMGVSLEVRVPFLSKQLINEAMKISPMLNTGGGKKKEVLKRLLKQEVPQAVITETKRGFTVPLGKWIKEDLKDYFADTLLSDSMTQYFGFDRKGIELLLQEQYRSGIDGKWALFSLMALFKWKENLKS